MNGMNGFLTPRAAANIGTVERWTSLAGGGVLALFGVTRRSALGAALIPFAGYLVYRGATGYCAIYHMLGADTATDGASGAAAPPARGMTVQESIVVNRPVTEVYRIWRRFENLPRFMRHLESVTTTGHGRSHWVAKAQLGAAREWDAEIITEQENKLIAWRSLGGASPRAGLVRFASAEGGTKVTLTLEYAPPAGLRGAGMARLFSLAPRLQVRGDLRRFKQFMESGEALTAAHENIAGRAPAGDTFLKSRHDDRDDIVRGDLVQEASEASFPASDPPSWAPGTAHS